MWHLNDSFDTSAGRVAAGSAGTGPALVLAHGWPWSSFSWHRVIPTLAAHYTVHWYDMPGFGRSDLSGPRSLGLDTQGQVFGEMLDHWGLDQPIVIAHDFGGAVSLRAHLLHGRDYVSWVMFNVVAMRPWGSAFFDHVGQHTEAFLGLPDHIHAAVVGAYIDGALSNPISPEDREALIAPWLGTAGKAAFYAQFGLADEAFTAAFEPMLPDIRCPVSILWGTADPWIPLARGQALADAIGVPLSPLDGLGHLPQLEDAARMSAALDTALRAA